MVFDLHHKVNCSYENFRNCMSETNPYVMDSIEETYEIVMKIGVPILKINWPHWTL